MLLAGKPMDTTQGLPAGEIHLWLTFCADVADEGLQYAYRKLLSDSELQKEARFHFAHDRRRYLIARALVRTVLSRYARVAPADWAFSTNPYGRPTIENAEAREARLNFNISHAQDIVVLAIAKGRALGVDVEGTAAREISMDVAEHCFAAAEVAALAVVPRPHRQVRFFEYWTFKESYIKARGMGLSLPLDKFSFRFPNDDSIEVDFHPDLNDDASRWQFWQLRPAMNYLLAVCAERVEALPSRVVVRRIVPLVREMELALPLLRASL